MTEANEPNEFNLPTIDPAIVEIAEAIAYEIAHLTPDDRRDTAALLVSTSPEVHALLTRQGAHSDRDYTDGRKIIHATVMLLADLHAQEGTGAEPEPPLLMLQDLDPVLVRVLRAKAKELLPLRSQKVRLQQELEKVYDALFDAALEQEFSPDDAHRSAATGAALMHEVMTNLVAEIESHAPGHA